MSYIFMTLLVVVLIGLFLWVFVNTDAQIISRSLKLVIPVSLLAFGIIATIAGRGQMGIPAIVASLVWWYNIYR